MTMQPSTAKTPNPAVQPSRRRPGEDNVKWLARHWGEGDDACRVILFGGTGPIDFRLRAAQAMARHDFSPSNWSHVALAGPAASQLARTPLTEISLAPEGGFGEPPATNALQTGRLGRYADAGLFPNVALFVVSASWAEVTKARRQLEKQRPGFDLVALTLSWLEFAWGAEESGNPLGRSLGIPSAAAAEALLNAAGFDLSPGLSSRGSSPESIWQGCRWWHGFEGRTSKRQVSGHFAVSNVLGQGPKKESTAMGEGKKKKR